MDWITYAVLGFCLVALGILLLSSLGDVCCPRCNSVDTVKLPGRGWRCRHCNSEFEDGW